MCKVRSICSESESCASVWLRSISGQQRVTVEDFFKVGDVIEKQALEIGSFVATQAGVCFHIDIFEPIISQALDGNAVNLKLLSTTLGLDKAPPAPVPSSESSPKSPVKNIGLSLAAKQMLFTGDELITPGVIWTLSSRLELEVNKRAAAMSRQLFLERHGP